MDATGPMFGQSKSDLRLGFGPFAIASSDVQLADAAFGDFDVIAYGAEILSLDQLSLRSGMAVEVTHFDNLLHPREWITVRHSHRAHKARLFAVQEIQGDGTMAVTRFLVGFRANDEGCRPRRIVRKGWTLRSQSMPQQF
jgi:hypothetical protein